MNLANPSFVRSILIAGTTLALMFIAEGIGQSDSTAMYPDPTSAILSITTVSLMTPVITTRSRNAKKMGVSTSRRAVAATSPIVYPQRTVGCIRAVTNASPS